MPWNLTYLSSIALLSLSIVGCQPLNTTEFDLRVDKTRLDYSVITNAIPDDILKEFMPVSTLCPFAIDGYCILRNPKYRHKIKPGHKEIYFYLNEDHAVAYFTFNAEPNHEYGFLLKSFMSDGDWRGRWYSYQVRYEITIYDHTAKKLIEVEDIKYVLQPEKLMKNFELLRMYEKKAN